MYDIFNDGIKFSQEHVATQISNDSTAFDHLCLGYLILIVLMTIFLLRRMVLVLECCKKTIREVFTYYFIYSASCL